MLTQVNIMIWVFVYTVVLLLAVMQWHGKLPSINSIRQFLTVMNSKGANIATLAAMSLFFFICGMKFIYWTIERMNEGKLTTDNSIVAQGVNWITGAAFGMVLSAMLKAMTGDGGQNRSTDAVPPGSTSTATVTSTTKTTTDATISPKPKEDAVQPSATQVNPTV